MNPQEYQFNKKQDRLRQMLDYAYNNIPFYKENMEKSPSYYLRDYSNWLQLPFLTKSNILQDHSSLVNTNMLKNNNYTVTHTSGSTGMPLKIIQSKKDELILTKRLWKSRRRYKADIMKSKLLYLYRDVESPNLNVLRSGNDNYVDLSDKILEKFVTDIKEFQPDWAIGSPSVMSLIADYFSKTGNYLSNLKLVEMYGEKIFLHQRELIEETFNCKVIDNYGMREFGVMSYECPYGKMHAWDDDLFFEVINKDTPVKNGKTGELYVTTLTNYFMPLIRYKVDDLVQISLDEEQCQCGNENNLFLVPKTGRVSQFMRTPSKTLPSVMFDTEFSRFIRRNPDSIRGFQVIQEELDSVNIMIVSGSNFKVNHLEELHGNFLKYATDITYKFKLVHKINPELSGKTKTFISRIGESGNSAK